MTRDPVPSGAGEKGGEEGLRAGATWLHVGVCLAYTEA